MPHHRGLHADRHTIVSSFTFFPPLWNEGLYFISNWHQLGHKSHNSNLVKAANTLWYSHAVCTHAKVTAYRCSRDHTKNISPLPTHPYTHTQSTHTHTHTHTHRHKARMHTPPWLLTPYKYECGLGQPVGLNRGNHMYTT